MRGALLLSVCCLILALPPSPFSAVQAEDASSNETPDVVRSSLTNDRAPSSVDALTLNFRKELGVALDYLIPLGRQISDARTSPDPVALAFAANNLAVAERVAGKRAALTADAVLAEAIELAKLRLRAPELTAMALLVGDPKLQAEFRELADAAKQADEARRLELEEGIESKAVHGFVYVTNHTCEHLTIYIDGAAVGCVPPHQRAAFSVCAPERCNLLEAYCPAGCLIRKRLIHGHRSHVRWHIDE